MTKRALIVLLVGVNLVLLATLVLASWPLPAAYAQPAPLGQNYVMVSGQINDQSDALYVVDVPQRRLHVFIPNRDINNRRVFYVGFRDLQRDFRGGR
ncbi:MAG TPA: hypothetical protein VMV94_11930 [Phycisphaerae bacterium]|nr:hypothetical protein [Phycisphaerae bacterium]